MKTYLFSYRHDGAEWGFQIIAESPSDAKARVARLQWATYEGELMATVPASLGWFARALVFIKNLGGDKNGS